MCPTRCVSQVEALATYLEALHKQGLHDSGIYSMSCIPANRVGLPRSLIKMMAKEMTSSVSAALHSLFPSISPAPRSLRPPVAHADLA